MAVKLNKLAFSRAKEPMGDGKVVLDKRDAWSEHRPFAKQENKFLRQHGFEGYARWYLGIDEDEHEETHWRYKFSCGDIESVHRCGVLAAGAERHRTSTRT